MDLDNIKKAWKNTDLNSNIKDSEIKQMICNQSKNSIERLLRHEKIGFIVGAACISISLLFQDNLLSLIYLFSLLCAILWQVYKYRLLKKIDILTMSILEISSYTTRYKKYIYSELIFGFIWTFIFGFLFIYRKIYIKSSDQYSIHIVVGIFVLSACLLFLAVYLLYRWLYFNNIKSLQISINEIKDFEK